MLLSQEARDIEVRKRLDEERRELELEARLVEDAADGTPAVSVDELEEGQVPSAIDNGTYISLPSARACFCHSLTGVCMRSKFWLAACVPLRLARARRSRRLCAMLEAAPAL